MEAENNQKRNEMQSIIVHLKTELQTSNQEKEQLSKEYELKYQDAFKEVQTAMHKSNRSKINIQDIQLENKKGKR